VRGNTLSENYFNTIIEISNGIEALTGRTVILNITLFTFDDVYNGILGEK
jgi:hypothetical protein